MDEGAASSSSSGWRTRNWFQISSYEHNIDMMRIWIFIGNIIFNLNEISSGTSQFNGRYTYWRRRNSPTDPSPTIHPSQLVCIVGQYELSIHANQYRVSSVFLHARQRYSRTIQANLLNSKIVYLTGALSIQWKQMHFIGVAEINMDVIKWSFIYKTILCQLQNTHHTSLFSIGHRINESLWIQPPLNDFKWFLFPF